MAFSKRTRAAAGIAIAIIVGLAAYYFLAARTSGSADALTALQTDFIDVLPHELSLAQVEEIENILILYNRRINQGQVARSDQKAITDKMEEYVAYGIGRRELEQFIALVSFFSYRLDPDRNPDDGSGVHPLLQPEEEHRDST